MKITIQRGLNKLKVLEKRISKEISELRPVALERNNQIVSDKNLEKDQFKKRVTAELCSINDLIKERNVIKSAIVKANCENVVKINDLNMSISDAIDYKNYYIQAKETLLSKLKNEFYSKWNSCSQQNDRMENNLQSLLENKASSNNQKDDQTRMFQESFRSLNETKVYDPCDIESEIKKIEKELEDFKSEIDVVLSEANNTIQIEIAD